MNPHLQLQELSCSLHYKKIPKIELHCHLEGSISFETILELHHQLGLPLPFDDKSELLDYFTITSPVNSLNDFLELFQRSQVVLKDKLCLQIITEKLIIEKYKDGVKLLEIRYSPHHIRKYGELTLDEIHQAILSGMKIGIEKCDSDIEVGLICIAQAGTSKENFLGSYEFFLKNKDTFIGFDNAGPEVSLTKYKDYFAEIKSMGLYYTIHAGEDAHTGNPQHVIDAIEILNAKRIGHGIQISKHPETFETLIKNETLLEICPTSNFMTGSVPPNQDHPIKILYENGIKVCVNSDDPGIFNSTLSGEYQYLARCLNFGVKDFYIMNKWALENSFMNHSAKMRTLDKYFKTEWVPEMFIK